MSRIVPIRLEPMARKRRGRELPRGQAAAGAVLSTQQSPPRP
jgi:hypothetical protein